MRVGTIFSLLFTIFLFLSVSFEREFSQNIPSSEAFEIVVMEEADVILEEESFQYFEEAQGFQIYKLSPSESCTVLNFSGLWAESTSFDKLLILVDRQSWPNRCSIKVDLSENRFT